MAYNLETILAEKFETIIRRNIGTTRPRDFYDLYALFKSRILEANKDDFIRAVENTAKKRGSLKYLSEWQEICEDIRTEQTLRNHWINYQKENKYAEGISYDDVVKNLWEVSQYLSSKDF